MRRHLNTLWAFALVAMALAACGAAGTSNEGRLNVVTTIYPLQYMVSSIGGEDADVRLLISANTEAHAFEPTASHAQAVASADLIVANGLGLEPWLDRIVDGLGEKPQLVEASNVQGANPDDPHAWLDPVLAQRQVERIRDAMSRADPDNEERYDERAQALIGELASIHQDYVASLTGCAHDHFVTTHAAYGYVAARYGLQQIAIAGVTAEDEPTPRYLAELTERVEELGPGHVMVEPVMGPRLAETVAAESGLEFLSIHQMESVTDQELAEHGDYLGLLRDNLASLRTALGCS